MTSASLRSPSLHTLCLATFIFIIFCSATLSLWLAKRGLEIETDLQSLSPSFIDDAALEDAMNAVSADLQQTILLVIKSHSREILEDLVDEVPDIIAELPTTTLDYLSSENSANQILNALRPHRFHLLTEQQSQLLTALDDTALLELAERRLHSLSGSARLLNLSEDPFGFVSDYVFNLLEELPGASEDSIVDVATANSDVYYAPLAFNLRVDGQNFQQQDRVLVDIKILEAAVKQFSPETTILHSGVVFFAAAAATNARSDITLISAGSSLGVLCLLLLFFRSLRVIVLPLVSITIGVGFAFICAQALFGSIHIFTIVFGASLIGVAIDYALHYCYHFQGHYETTATSKLYRALALSLLTSVIGYSALSFSGLLVLQQVAVFSALGLIAACVTVVTLGPILLSAHRKTFDAGLQQAIHMLLNQCKKLTAPWIGIVYCLLLVSAGVFIFKQLQTSDNPRSFFTADPQLLSEEAELQSVLSSYEPATYLVVAGDSEQAVFDRLEELFAQQPRARGLVFGIHQLLPSPKLRQQYLQQNDRLYGEAGIAQTFLAQLGVNADEVSSLLLSYQQAQQHPPTAQQLMDGKTLPLPPLWAMIDNKHYHFLLLQSGVELDPLRSFAESNDHIYFIDTVGMSTDVIRSLRQSALSLLTIALALIAILLLIRYRSLRKLGLLAVPIAAITITLGLFSLFGVAVSLFHTMALFLVLGLGMDYVIFVADLYSEDKQSQRTLCAVLLSAMTSLLAFGLLSLSDLPAVQAFGVTVLVGNTINIIGSVFVMRFLNAAN